MIRPAMAKNTTNPGHSIQRMNQDYAILSQKRPPTVAGGRDSKRNVDKRSISQGRVQFEFEPICKQAEVGHDYPAKVEKNKIHLLLSDSKTCDARIESTHEAE
jgi:hypothetical protein